MKIKKYLFLLLALSTFVSAFAQYDYPDDAGGSDENGGEKTSKYRESKFFFGGYLGLSFGSYTYIELAPIVGYKITPRLSAGLGPKYMYIKESNFYETSVYGLKALALFAIFKDLNKTINLGIGDIFAYVENETLNIEPIYLTNNGYVKGERGWVNITLVGGGLRFPMGARAGLSIILLWDVSQNPYYNYSNPELRISIDF